MSKTNQQGRFGAYLLSTSSGNLSWTKITDWLVRIQIK